MTTRSKARYDAQIDAGLTAIHRWDKSGEVARAVATRAREGLPGGLPYAAGQPIRVDGLRIEKF